MTIDPRLTCGNVLQRHDAGEGVGRAAPLPRSGWVQGRSLCRTHRHAMLKCALAPLGAAGCRGALHLKRGGSYAFC
jgi:hypothetical protein